MRGNQSELFSKSRLYLPLVSIILLIVYYEFIFIYFYVWHNDVISRFFVIILWLCVYLICKVKFVIVVYNILHTYMTLVSIIIKIKTRIKLNYLFIDAMNFLFAKLKILLVLFFCF